MNKMIFVAALLLTACSPNQSQDEVGNLQNTIQIDSTPDNAMTSPAYDNANPSNIDADAPEDDSAAEPDKNSSENNLLSHTKMSSNRS